MSAASLVSTAQDRFPALRQPIADRYTTLDVRTGGYRLRCVFTQIDTIGVAVQSLSFTAPYLATYDVTQRREEVQRLAARLSYLLENLQLCELDSESQVAQMRSELPAAVDGGIEYFELLVDSDVTLMRYRKLRDVDRTPVAFNLTQEVFWRLLEDILITT